MRYLTPVLFAAAASVLNAPPAYADFGDQLFKLLADDGAPDDEFGRYVAISGDTAIVGAFFDDDHGTDSGSAYLFNTTTGEQIAKLLADDGTPFDQFGNSVAISGTTAIVGAPFDDDNGPDSGSAYLFDITTGAQIAKLLPEDGDGFDWFGLSVAISASPGKEVAIVGAPFDDDNGSHSGSAYLFDISNPANPVQIAKLLPDDGGPPDFFGHSVAISGTIAIVGEFRDDEGDDDSGAAYLFDTTTGEQIAKLLADDGASDDAFGWSVAISGATAFVGAHGDDDNGSRSGSAYLFDISNPANPVQIAKLLPNDGAVGEQFGYSVAISGVPGYKTAIVGAWVDGDNGPSSGSAYLFDITTGQQIAKLLPDDGAQFDYFGISVTISGDTALVGAVWDDDNGYQSGSAYLFDAAVILRVDDDAPPGGNGLSWPTAYRFLQDALADAAVSGVNEIRAAQGLYKPDQSEANPNGTGDREAKFQMLHGLSLVGGYAGIGAKDPNARDYELYETILSGDIGEIDSILDNSYHVISASGANQTVVLDGLIVTRGFADGSPPHNRGAGLIIDNGIAEVLNSTFLNNGSHALPNQVAAGAAISSSASNLTLTNCTFIQNRVTGNSFEGIIGGGAISASNSTITGSGCRFISNTVSVSLNTGPAQGGALRVSSSSVLTLTDCWFIDNVAKREDFPTLPGDGGGLYIWSSTTSLTNCVFVANRTPSEVGTSRGSGIYAIDADIALMNCLFSSNVGTGIYLEDGSVLSAANSILWGNTGGAGTPEEEQIDLDNGSSVIINYSDVEGWTGNYGGSGNIGEDPLFVGGPSGTWTEDAKAGSNFGTVVYTDSNASFTPDKFVGATISPFNQQSLLQRYVIANTATTITVLGFGFLQANRYSYEIHDHRLSPGSPCIDAADNTAVPKGIDTDLDGNPRFVDDPDTKDTGFGDPPIVDMGAYEFQPALCPADLDNSGDVGVKDLLFLLGTWGPCPPKGDCPADFDNSGDVGVKDLLFLLGAWGPCA